jgi:hypothetical protein
VASITGNGSKGHHKFILTVTQSSQNVANNTSTVSYKFQIAPVQTSWNWEQWGAYIKYSFKVNGTEYTGSIDSYDGYSTVTLKSGTQTVTHNSDGTKSISYSLSVTDTSGVSYTSGNASASGTLALSTIARATAPTLSATSVVANGSNSINITVTPASGTFKHKVRYDFGSLTGQYSGVSIGSDFSAQGNTTVKFTPPANLCNQIPNAKSGTLTIKLYTYTSSGTHIGTKSVTMTLTVPTYMPSIGVPEISGDGLLYGEYVAGKSKATIYFDVASSYGATIAANDITATIDGKTYKGNMFTTSVLSSGNKSVSIKVTDSRGYAAAYVTPTTDMITVYAYSNPTITEFTLTRQEDGTTVVATVKGTVSAVNNKNAKTITVTLNGVPKTITSSEYTINGTATFTGVNTDVTYTGTAKIQDSYTSVSKNAVVPTVAVTMDFLNDGKGVAFGKVAEESDLLDVNWKSRFRKVVSVLSNAFEALTITRAEAGSAATIKFLNGSGALGYIGMSGTANNGLTRWSADGQSGYSFLDTGNTKDYVVEQGTNGIWTYRKWNSGVAECWGNVSTTPTTVNGNNAVSANLPFTFVGTDYKVNISPAKAAMYVTAFGDCATNGNLTHTTTSFTMAYKYSYGTAYAVSFNVNVYGKWK